MKWKYQKETHLFGLVWLNSSKLNFETCLCSTEPNYQSHHLWFFFVSSFTNLWFGLFCSQLTSQPQTQPTTSTAKNKTIFLKQNNNQKVTLIVCVMNRFMIFDDFFNKQKESWFFFWFCQPNQPFDTSFSQIKSNQFNWL